MTRNIDELSNLRSEPPEQYFGKMRISKEQKAKRVEYTKKANDILDLILVLLLTMDDRDFSMYSYLRDRLESELLSLMNEYAEPDDYLIDYASDFAYNFIDVTRNNIENEWFTSSDRALYNAENCANDFHNYVEYRDAVMAGKTHKKWLAEPDNKVRESHQKVDGKKIPIKEFFRVGLARMRFPKDYEFASAFPRELINCRCGIEYLPKDEEISRIQRNDNTAWAGKPRENSEEDIESLKSYVENLGLVLGESFTHYDGDISLVREFADNLSNHINMRQPHVKDRKVVLNVSYTMQDADYAETKRTSVTINGNAYRDRNLLEKDYAKQVKKKFFTQGSTYKDISVHEAAHVINDLNDLKTKNILPAIFGLNVDSAKNKIFNNISEYAMKDAKELIAESYVAYTNGSTNEYVLKVLKYCGML